MNPKTADAVETGKPARAEMFESVCEPRTFCKLSALSAFVDEPLNQLETISDNPARRNFSINPPSPPLWSWMRLRRELSKEVVLLALSPYLLSTSLIRRSIAPME